MKSVLIVIAKFISAGWLLGMSTMSLQKNIAEPNALKIVCSAIVIVVAIFFLLHLIRESYILLRIKR